MLEDSRNPGEQALSDEEVEALYLRFGTDVLRVSYFYLGNREQAEDVTQDVFVRLMENRPVLTPGSEKAWLLKVALNRCRDLWRSSWVKRVLLGSDKLELIPAPDEFEGKLEKEALMQAVNALPAPEREVFLLFYYQGFSTQETAQVLGVAEGTVSSRLSRGRVRLRNQLGGEEP
ncbi:MAG TPA: sigma-70 family RNA polymerase sigma factor [Candidatus Limnocylindria bacterium]|nr:sigma-70 family RNA polymerase sigma factor [Candidatus Limnocylindria bacterium]